MTKITSLVGAFLCFSVTSLNAQINYDLKDFQSPEVKYQGLDADLYLSGDGSAVPAFNDDVNSVRGSGDLQYFRYQNSDRYIGRSNVSFRANMYFDETNNLFGDQTQQNVANHFYQIRAYSRNNFYWDERSGYFLRADGFFSGRIQNNFLQQTSGDSLVSDLADKRYLQTSHAMIGIGHGRIEPVGYARLAYDMYAMLGRKNLVDKPTKAQIEALADVMIDVVNTRFFDSRFQTIYQLEQIDSTLRSQGLGGEMPVSYFAQLADVWNSANRFTRGSGSEISAGFKAVFDSYRLDQTNEVTGYRQDTNRTSYAGILAYINYSNEKPLNIKWQRSFSITAEMGDVDDGYVSDKVDGRLHGTYGLGWYPNTRTRFNLDVSAAAFSGRTVIENSPNTIHDRNITYSTGIAGSFYYWITPRFRFYGGINMVYGYIPEGYYLHEASLEDTWWGFVRNDTGHILSGTLALSYAIF